MNINQAKTICGFTGSIGDRAGILSAERHCKAAIVEARKAGDDHRAARLSEAFQVFKKRLRGNRCAVCGTPINPAATMCGVCSRHQRKVLPPSHPVAQSTKPARPNRNERIGINPAGGPLATMGFYTAPVQRVVKRWGRSIPQTILEGYFTNVSAAVMSGHKLAPPMASLHWQAMFEIGAAFAETYNAKITPEAWLLRQPLNILKTDRAFESWQDVITNIVNRGGPRFTKDQIVSAAKRMRLLSPHVKKAA